MAIVAAQALGGSEPLLTDAARWTNGSLRRSGVTMKVGAQYDFGPMRFRTNTSFWTDPIPTPLGVR